MKIWEKVKNRLRIVSAERSGDSFLAPAGNENRNNGQVLEQTGGRGRELLVEGMSRVGGENSWEGGKE